MFSWASGAGEKRCIFLMFVEYTINIRCLQRTKWAVLGQNHLCAMLTYPWLFSQGELISYFKAKVQCLR